MILPTTSSTYSVSRSGPGASRSAPSAQPRQTSSSVCASITSMTSVPGPRPSRATALHEAAVGQLASVRTLEASFEEGIDAFQSRLLVRSGEQPVVRPVLDERCLPVVIR